MTYPLDTKQYRKIILRCWRLADRNRVRLRRYRKEVRACVMVQGLRKDRARERRHAEATEGYAPLPEP